MMVKAQKNEFWDDLFTEGWFVSNTNLGGFTIQGEGQQSKADFEIIQEDPIIFGGSAKYIYKLKIFDDQINENALAQGKEFRVTLLWMDMVSKTQQRATFYADLGRKAFFGSRFDDFNKTNVEITALNKDDSLLYPGSYKYKLFSSEIVPEKNMAYLKLGINEPVQPGKYLMQANWGVFSTAQDTSLSAVQGPTKPQEYTIPVSFSDIYDRPHVFWQVTYSLLSNFMWLAGAPLPWIFDPLLYFYQMYMNAYGFVIWFVGSEDPNQAKLFSLWNYFWVCLIKFTLVPQLLIWIPNLTLISASIVMLIVNSASFLSNFWLITMASWGAAATLAWFGLGFNYINML